MEGGRLKFSIGDNGQMFCPFQTSTNNKSSSAQETHIKYDTG